MNYNKACKVFELDRKSKFHTADNIKTVYRRLCKKHHPDKGGDVAMMQQVNVAYDVLLQHLKGNHFANTYQFEPEYDEWLQKLKEEMLRKAREAAKDFKGDASQEQVPPRKTAEEIVQEILTWETANLHVSILKTITIHGNSKKSIVVSGNTYPHKEKLKEFGFKFDFDIKVWRYN